MREAQVQVKTTLLNAMSFSISPQERIITIEDTRRTCVYNNLMLCALKLAQPMPKA
ncbi:hypothetical protein O9992_22035 [Vibrio lentus]|nr:hypothetical protein [Vibrio lentus]